MCAMIVACLTVVFDIFLPCDDEFCQLCNVDGIFEHHYAVKPLRNVFLLSSAATENTLSDYVTTLADAKNKKLFPPPAPPLSTPGIGTAVNLYCVSVMYC